MLRLGREQEAQAEIKRKDGCFSTDTCSNIILSGSLDLGSRWIRNAILPGRGTTAATTTKAAPVALAAAKTTATTTGAIRTRTFSAAYRVTEKKRDTTTPMIA